MSWPRNGWIDCVTPPITTNQEKCRRNCPPSSTTTTSNPREQRLSPLSTGTAMRRVFTLQTLFRRSRISTMSSWPQSTKSMVQFRSAVSEVSSWSSWMPRCNTTTTYGSPITFSTWIKSKHFTILVTQQSLVCSKCPNCTQELVFTLLERRRQATLPHKILLRTLSLWESPLNFHGDRDTHHHSPIQTIQSPQWLLPSPSLVSEHLAIGITLETLHPTNSLWKVVSMCLLLQLRNPINLFKWFIFKLRTL